MTELRTLRLTNSLSRKVEALERPEGRPVLFYSCGPTVYNVVHIGNLRAFTFYDLLKRSLRYLGYAVKHVMNITDVDDKTIRRSIEEGMSLRAFTDRYTELFFEDLKALRIEPPDLAPRATETIEAMVAMTQALLAKGLAYRSDDGSVYFSIAKFDGYGQLVDLDRASLEAGRGGRVAADEYDKENASDFALWKAWSEEDGPVFWETALGKGRPGWHLECSAMAREYLAETIDIHSGGIDLLFPHHENEIAQSEGANEQTFARFFVHNKHLLINGRKMSKSLGNFYTRADLAELCGATGRELRLALMRVHYTKQLSLTVEYDAANRPVCFESILDVRAMLSRIDDFVAAMRAKAGDGEASEATAAVIAGARGRFADFLADDLNISGALSVVFELLSEGHKGAAGPGDASAYLSALEDFDAVLQVLPEEEGLPAELFALLDERLSARAAKDWARSDAIRDEFAARGYLLKDTSEGQQWRKL